MPIEDPTDGPPDVSVTDLIDQLSELEATVDSPEERREVRQARLMASGLEPDRLLGDRIRKYTTRDMAEAFVGAVLFSIPLLVEDGVFDIAAHFSAAVVLGVPVFLVGNAAFVIVLAYGLLYWADLQQVVVYRPLLGVVPRRLAGALVISLLTVAAMMTLWGRLEGWADPTDAVARISVVWTIAAFGAGLGDILPGESEGQDINDVLADR